jgi:hypothetical protein
MAASGCPCKKCRSLRSPPRNGPHTDSSVGLGEQMLTPDAQPIIRPQHRKAARHYHVIENRIGDPLGYHDDVFPSRRQAQQQARTRAEWLALVAGLQVEALSGSGRYLVTTRRAGDPGRLIEVEACEDASCLEADYDITDL